MANSISPHLIALVIWRNMSYHSQFSLDPRIFSHFRGQQRFGNIRKEILLTDYDVLQSLISGPITSRVLDKPIGYMWKGFMNFFLLELEVFLFLFFSFLFIFPFYFFCQLFIECLLCGRHCGYKNKYENDFEHILPDFIGLFNNVYANLPKISG